MRSSRWRRNRASTAIHPGYGFLVGECRRSRAPARQPASSSSGRRLITSKRSATRRRRRSWRSTPACRPSRAPRTPSPTRREVEAAAARIGFPLMIKASFGGGGRGMRVVQNADELDGKLAEAQREAGRRVRTAGGLPRTLHRARQAHRGADPRRCARQPRAPVGARLLGPAAAPEGRRGRAQHQSARGAARGRSANRPRRCADRSATAAPAPSSSCSTSIATSSSSSK